MITHIYICTYIVLLLFILPDWTNQLRKLWIGGRRRSKTFSPQEKESNSHQHHLKLDLVICTVMESLTQIKDHNKEPHYLYGIPNPYFLFFTLHIGAHWHCFLCIPCQRPLCQPKQKHRNTCIKDCFSCLDFQNILMTEVDWQPSSESVKFQILEIWRRYMLLGWPSSQLRTAF